MALFCFLTVPIGFLVGVIAGAVVSGYLMIFLPIYGMESAAHTQSWATMIALVAPLLFAKVGIFLGAVLGGVIGVIPSFVGLHYCDQKRERK